MNNGVVSGVFLGGFFQNLVFSGQMDELPLVVAGGARCL
jgi:hypothetical protein